MPIQFRCGGCNQLLGIATRKAGAVVHCPTCGGKTIVPRPRDALEKAAGKRNDFSLLERVDVDKLLGAPIPGKMLTPKPISKNGSSAKHSVGEMSGPAAAAVATSPGPKGEPKEMRALSQAQVPDESAIDVNSLEDDDGPIVLDDTASKAALVLGSTGLLGAILTIIAIVAGAFALGYWFGGK